MCVISDASNFDVNIIRTMDCLVHWVSLTSQLENYTDGLLETIWNSSIRNVLRNVITIFIQQRQNILNNRFRTM